MAQNIEIPVSLGLKDAQAQINQLRQSLQQSVKLDSTAGKGLLQILNNAQKMVDNLTGKMSTSFKSAPSSSSFLKDYEKMIGLLTTATEKMTNLGVTDIKFSVADQQTVDSTIQKIQNLQASLESIQSGKAIEVINMSQVDGIDNLKQKLTELKIDASKFTFDEIGIKLGEAASKADTEVQKLTNDIANINSQMNKLNTQGFTDISKLSDFSTKGIARILEAGNVDSINNKLQKLASTMAEITVKPMTVTAGQNIDSVIESQTRAIEKKYNEQIQAIQQSKEKVTAAITQVTETGMRTAANGKTSSGHWTNEQMQSLMSMPSVENIINRLKADTTLNFDNLGIRQQFAKFREALNEELNSLNTKDVNLQGLRNNVKDQVTEVFEGAGEAIVGNRSQLQSSIKALFSNLGVNGDELKKIFDINSISSGDKMVDVIDRIKQGLTDYIATLDKTANTDLAAKLKEAQAAFDGLTQAQNINKNVSQGSGKAAQTLQNQINTLTKQIQDLIDKYNQLTEKNLNFDTGNIEGAKGHIESYIQSLNKLAQKQKALGNVQMAVNRWMGFWQVLNMTKTAINDMKRHIQELDTVMTSISVVTNFSQEDLWGQISQYSEIARQYGVAIKGVYEVSQIYYQQGLQQNDVMTLTTETLKMARIAGLDYATAADYMTTAIRGFKLEMTDAAHVTDVFSALAATTASSTEEIAVAISKTAASAEAVGASFEATSAMMATMIATTRESATNIGTALKSVISRYGEMTGDPSKTVDSEGEEMSLNRVDKALQTVGITIHDTAGQFRDFDDVMLELMEKWGSLDSLSQRYIATLMAGNRQQSRFLALVSNVDAYKKALQTAMDSEGTGELQTLKTLDSIDAKIEKMKVTIQEFYTSSGLEEMYKSILDTITNVISAANDMPKVFGKIPVQALAVATSLIAVVKNALTVIISNIQASLKQAGAEAQSTTMNTFQSMVASAKAAGAQAGGGFWSNFMQEGNGKVLLSKIGQIVGSAVQLLGANEIISGANKYGASTSIEQDKAAGRTTGGGALLSILGSTASGAALGSVIPGLGTFAGGIAGAIEGIITNIPALVTGFQQWNVTLERSVELAQKNAQEQKTAAQRAQGEFKALNSSVDKFKQLEAAQYDSAEATQEFKDYVNQLADSYPNLISKLEVSGDYNIQLTDLEKALAAAREKSAMATANATKAELDSQQTTANAFEKAGNLQSSFGKIQSDAWDSYSDIVTNFDEMWDALWLNDIKLPQQLQKQAGESSSDAIQRLYNALNPDSQIKGKLDFTTQAPQIFNSLLDFTRYDTQGYAESDVKALKSRVESMIKIDSSLSSKELTGFETLDNLNSYEILIAYEKFNKIVQDYANYHNETAETLSQQLVADEASIAIAETASNNLGDNFDYDAHEKIISSLVSYNEWGQKLAESDTKEANDFEEYTKKKTQEYLNYFKEREEGLNFLENSLQLKNFSTEEQLITALQRDGQLGNDVVGKEIQDIYIQKWKEQRKNIVDLYKKQLSTVFTNNNLIPDFLNNSDQFTGSTLTAIQSDLKQYQSLIKKQQYAQAEAYLHNMEEIYGENGFGQLTDEQQTQAYDVIKVLDLSDPEALHTAAATLANMGTDFKGLSDTLANAALRWATSAATLLEQLTSSAKDTAKSIETSTSDMSKVFKYSEALEKAQAIMDANEGVKFNELFTYDKDLGGYVKTAKTFQLEMAEFENEQYENIKQSIDDYQNILPTIAKSRVLKGHRNDKDAKNQFAKQLNLDLEKDSVAIDRLWIEYNSMVDEFEASGKSQEEWNDFVTEYLKTRGEDLAKQLKEIQQMPQKMAQEALQSFDYTSVVSGKGTAQNKETLKALLMAAADNTGENSPANQIDKYFNGIYDLLIQGKIDEYNKQLEYWGLNEYQVSEDQANRARFESLISLYEKIASGDVIFDALTQQEQNLLNSTLAEGSKLSEGASVAQVGTAADSVWAAILLLIKNGAGLLSEITDSISSRANKIYGNISKEKSYQLLDKYKDGLTADELQALQGENDGLLINASTGQLSEEAEKYLIYDNGKFIAKAGQDAASVLAFLAQALGYHIDATTEEYKKSIEDATNEQIAKNDAENYDKNLRNTLKSIFSGSEGDQINVAGLSEVAKKRLVSAGYNVSDNILTIGTEQAMNNAAIALEQQVNNGDWFWKHYSLSATDVTSQSRQLQASMAKNAAFEGIIGEQFNQSAAEALSMALQNTTEYSKVQSLMTEMGFKWDQAAQVWKASAESIEATRNKIRQSFSTGEIDNETYLNLIASLNETAEAISPKTKQDNALLDMLQNYNNVSEAMRAAFINNFYQYGIKASDFLTKNDNGTYDVNVGALKSFLDSIGFEYDEAARSEIEAITDSYLSNIQTAATYSTQGASSLADIEAFRQSYADIVHESLNADAFQYDSLTQSFILDPAAMHKYIDAQKEILTGMGYTEKFVNAYITDQTDKAIQASIELDGFLNANTSKQRNDEANKLIQQIRGLSNYQAIQKSAYISQNENIENENVARNFNKLIEEEKDLIILRVLESGGQDAVNLLKQIKPDASADELSSVYSNAINRLNDALSDAGEFIKGSMINTTSKLYQVLRTLNPEGVNADGVITATYDMVEVYTAIYAEMSKTAGATTAGLNDAYAKLLTAQDQTNIDITEALRNGAGMSYADFGNLLAKYDISFEEYMTDHFDTVMRDGFGNIRITDWEGFAKNIFKTNDLNTIKNTDEYISAFKVYNDGLIELNKNTEEAITEEIQQIADAKAGDWLNLSELWTALEDSFASKDWTRYMGQAQDNEDYAKALAKQAWNQSIQGQLEQWGATFENGILKLGDNVNLLGIAQTLESAAAQAGLELGNGLEEVKDTVLDILGAYTEAITNGIKGGLDNFGAQDLRNKADNLGISNINFEQTIDGLKLSQQSAIKLYRAIAKVDAIQGNIVFKELSESLKESNENFTTTSALLSHIVDLTGKIQVEDGKVSSARLEQYKAELEVAKEIVAVRSAAEDDSFNFMDNEIPAGQNNPLNYAKNWTKALKAIKDAYKVKNTRDLKAGGVKRTSTGYMGYEDFYNVINEINNMAGIMKQPMTIGKTLEGDAITLDGSLTSASDAIMHGINTLTAVDTGEMMVNIGALGINLAKGGKDFENNIDAGIDAVADAQIHALDGMIAMLELIVAMESLGDIAGEDMTIDLPDIAVDADGDGKLDALTEQYQTWLEKFDKLYETNDKLKEVVDGININGMTWRDWLKRDAAQWSKVDAQILDALYQAAISTDWNLDDIGGSLQQMLNSGKFGELVDGFTINIGDITYTISNGVVVEVADWSTDQAKDVLKQYQEKTGQKDTTKARQEISELIQEYLNGEGATTELPVTEIIKLRHNALIKHDKNGDYIEVTGPDGKPIRYNKGSNGFKAAIQAQVLKDQQGIDAKNVSVDYEGGTATATATYGIKNKTQFKVTTDDNGNVDWQIDPKDPLKGYISNNRHFSTQSELLHAIYDGLQANANAGSEEAQQLLRDSTSFESFVYAHYGIHVKVQTEVYKDDGNGEKIQVEDPSKDSKFRKAVKEALEKPIEFESDGEGKTILKAGDGYTIQVDTDDITVDGKEDPELMAQKMREAMGIDEALKDTITESITEAFKDLSTQISELDSEPLTKIADAISTIAITIDTLSKNKGIEALNEELDKLDTETLEAIGTAFETISNNLQTLAVNGNWVILTVALTLINTLLTSINEHSNVFEIIATSLSTFPTDVLDTIKNTLMEMAGALENIDAKRQIQLDIKADGLDIILSKLQEIAASLEKIAGTNVTVNSNDNGANSPRFIDPRKFNLPDPSKYGLPSPTPQVEAPSFANGDGPINPNFVQKIKTEYEQPSNTIEPPAEKVKVQGEVEVEDPEIEESTLDIKSKVDEGPIDSAIAKATSPQTLPVDTSLDASAVDSWQPPNKTATVTYTAIFSAASGLGNAIGGAVSGLANKLSNAWGRVFSKGRATGNAGLAKAKGTSTLMGELGPELVVSNGRYFVAGQNGAEMVDLADDAIVFNHLQTEQLLKKGVSSSRGKAITSEQNAVAFAKGNINGGPAMASASAALAALKQLRAMWESLKSAKVSDLAGAGGGGGGGGGGSSNKANIVEPGAWIDTVERWYDLTQKIAKLEKEITYQEQIRSKISSDWQKDGAAYFRSQEKSLTALREQIRAQEQLNISRQTYFNKRIAALKDEAISRIYTIDNEGQLKFTTDEVINGKKGGMEFLTDLYGFNNLGKANYTNKEKYDILQRNGFGAYMKYDSNGQEIKPKADNDGTISEENWESFYESATEAFRDRLDSISEATQSLWDSIQEGNEELEKLETDRNGILEEIRENQMDVEQSVLDAIISTRQRAIDEMQETRDALQDSTDKYIEGLNDALQKERQMYETQESQAELTRKQRQLGILQRSGGSASEIKALADDIKNSERDLYFELQQQQIDQLQETADLQIERMDTQINLMTELLEFEKTYGLLWDDVYTVMSGSADQIASFCIGNNADFWAQSPLEAEDTYNNLLFGSENWTTYRDEIEANGGSFATGIANVDTSTQAVETQAETIANILATEDRRQQMDREYTDYDKAMKAEYGEDYDKSGKYKKIFETEYMSGRNITEATEVARKQYYTDVVAPAEAARRAAEEEAARKAAAAAAATPAPTPANSGGGGGNSETKCADCAVNCGGACYNACQNGCAKVCRGSTNKEVTSNLGNQTCEGNCTGTAKGHVGNFKSTTNKGSAYSSAKDDNKSASRNKYVKPAKTAAGGYVNHGYYELGERGTETVLTASQTQVLRNNILSDRPSSLISLLKTYNEGFSRMNNATSALSESVQDNSVTIEKVDLNMNVQQLSNDYDAKRAGDQVLSEILRVAKKTSAANSVRR